MSAANRNISVGLWLLIVGLAVTGSASAQNADTARAALTLPVIDAGRETLYTIDLPRSKEPTEFPKSIDVAGLTFIYKHKALQFVVIDGRSKQRWLLAYLVSSETPGTYEIPPQTIKSGDEQLITNSASLRVREAGSARSGPQVWLDVAKAELFVGEVSPISLVIKVPPGTTFRHAEHPKLTTEGFAVKRFIPATLTSTSTEGSEYRYRASFSAIKPGQQMLGGAELAFEVVPGPGSPRVRTPLGRTITQRFRMRAEPVAINVRPLPREGIPDSFAGAVGEFTMRVTAAPKTLNVRDPLVIDSKITGTGNFDRVTAPVLSKTDGWKLQEPREYIENRSNGLTPGTTAFSQVVQPLRIVDALPTLEFSYFDPVAEAYRVLRSDSIPLAISSEPVPEAQNIDGKDFTAPVASVPREDLGDILAPFRRPGDLRKVDGSDAPPPLVLRATIIAAFLVVLGIVGYGLATQVGKWNRSRATGRKRPGFRSSADWLDELERGGQPVGRFYQMALGCLDAMATEKDGQWDAAASVDADAIAAIRERAHYFKYGASMGKASEAVNASERTEVVGLLRELRSVVSSVKGEMKA